MSDGKAVLDKLFPAVVQCFFVTFCGYLARRFNVISSLEGRGIELFVGKFALPSLIFLSLATLNFEFINWNFLLAIFIAKTIVFFLVFLITLMVTQPTNPSLAALFAIFCTQSNDFAMGYPIISAIYGSTHPEFVNYLYLVAPVSLCILNPFGFMFMELWNRNHPEVDSEGSRNVSVCRLLASSVKRVLSNPIVLMTALGVIANFTFQHTLPTVLYDILDTFSASFSATALFVLGLRMVNPSGHRSQSSSYLTPLILIMAKSAVLPLVTRQTMSVIQGSGQGASNTTVDLTNYAFLYGILPTAPSVLVYASQYQTAVQTVANSLVIGTFVSAPLMFVSAWLVSLYSTVAPSQYIHYINVYLSDVSIIGLVCCVWVLGVFLISGRFRRVPHFLTFCLVLSQSVACVGAILATHVDASSPGLFYLHFVPLAVGVFSSRVWTALVAVALLLIERRSLCYVLRRRLLFVAVGWTFPTLLTVALLVSNGGRHMYEGDPNFELGEYQSIAAVLILGVSLSVTLVCLVLHHRHRHRPALPGAAAESDGDTDALVADSEDAAPRFDVDQMVCSSSQPCVAGRRHECWRAVRNYLDDDGNELADDAVDADELLQVKRHVMLLLLLSLSMTVGLFLSVWNLFMDTMTGIYAEVDFIDGALNFGQGLMVLLLFGLDSDVVIAPLVRRWRLLMYGQETVRLPESARLSDDTRHVCHQFVAYHAAQCRRDVVTDVRCGARLHRRVFSGRQLVDWLVRVGLAADRADAVLYGTRLLDGRVIRHHRQQHHFHDRPLLYQLVNSMDAASHSSLADDSQ